MIATAEKAINDAISALLRAAVANYRIGDRATAADTIVQALVIAEPYDAYQPFLDGGPEVRAALVTLVPPVSYAARVLQLLGRDNAEPADSCPLTPSELAVVRLLPSFLTNREIAATLFLSVNTVKTHLKSAYIKLGVSSRREAIARARHLRLV